MMNPVVLIDDLATYISNVVRDYDMDTKGSGSGVPEVYVDSAPFNNHAKSNYPLVIVRFEESTTDTTKVKIISGAYSEDGKEGWRDVVNILQRINIEIGKSVAVSKKYTLSNDPIIKLPEEQPIPIFLAEMSTVWRMQTPQKEVNWKELFHDN